MSIRKYVLGAIGAALLPNIAFSQTSGTAEQAMALLDKAVSHYKEVGRDKAFADFDNKDGAYVQGDLYVFCYGPDHTMSAHGTNPALIGKDIGIFKDSDGQPFADNAYKTALANGQAQVDYRWTDPISKKIQPKSSFYQKVADGEVCGVGFYK